MPLEESRSQSCLLIAAAGRAADAYWLNGPLRCPNRSSLVRGLDRADGHWEKRLAGGKPRSAPGLSSLCSLKSLGAREFFTTASERCEVTP